MDSAKVGRLQNKVILVTAAAQGIGKATCLAFRDEGAIVYATDVNRDKLTELDAEPRITALYLDVTNQESIDEVFKSINQPLDALFNCAGFVASGSLLVASEQDWDFSFDLNVKGMFRMCKTFLPGMLENGGGSIINMSSVASSLKGVLNRCVYSTTKAAVIGLTKSIAMDHVSKGVRCNAICPGTIETESFHERMVATGDAEKSMKEFIGRQAMGRLGQPHEIASLAIYLASDESKFATGQEFIIDGGWKC